MISSKRQFIAVAVLVFVGYVLASRPAAYRTNEASHYSHLAEGYLAGQLHLSALPDPRLVALPDPYDPSQRGDIPYYWDASYYGGKYYLYFTPLPALLVYIPFHIVFGVFPPGQLVAVLFGFLIFLFTALTVRRLVPEEFRGGPLFVLLLAVVALGNLVTSHLQSGHVWSVANLCSNTFATAFFYFAARAWTGLPSTKIYFLMGLCFGCAAFSRLSLLPLGLLLAVTVFKARDPKKLLVAVVPVVFIGALALWHNYARFGNALEAGTRLLMQHVRMDFRFCHPFDSETFSHLFNALPQYLFALPKLKAGFPFIDYPRAIILPEDMDRLRFPPMEVAGLLVFFPYLLFGLLALVLLLRARKGGAPILFGAVLAAAGFSTGYLVSTCGWTIARYSLDFFWPITVAALVGSTWLWSLSSKKRFVGPFFVTLWTLGIVVGSLLSFVPAS